MSFFHGYLGWMWGYMIGKMGERQRIIQYRCPLPPMPIEYYKNTQMNYRYNK